MNLHQTHQKPKDIQMELYQATSKEDGELRKFFNNQTLSGFFDYKWIRTHRLSDQYRLTSKDFLTWFLRDNENQIQAMVSVLFKKAYINHQEQSIGCVTDLRVSSSHGDRLLLVEKMVPAIEKAKLERGCQYLFSDLEQYENNIYNRLLRERNRSQILHRYHLFRKFSLVFIYGRKFLYHKPLESIKIEYAQNKDIEPLCHYLQEKSVRRPLRYSIEPDELERRCNTWPGFSIHHFLIARNSQGRIIGCMAPWNNSQVQKMVPQHYHKKSFQIYSTSRTLSFLSITRSLPKEQQAFKIKCITHGAYDNPDIFYSLLTRAYNDCKEKELLVYPNYAGDYATKPPLSLFSMEIPYGFYCLLDADTRLPSYLRPNPFHPAPDFQYSYF